MPKYGDVRLNSATADELKRRAKEAHAKQKNSNRGTKAFRDYVENKIASENEVGSATNYYNAIFPRSMMRITLDPILKAFGFDPADETLYDFDESGMEEETIQEQETPDEYSYYIKEALGSHRVAAHFVPLEAGDREEILSDDWRGIFRAVWERIIDEQTLFQNVRKLVCESGDDTHILGLIFLADGQDEHWTFDSLLEAAPFNQYNPAARSYRGVGKALVARLIAEHTHRGYQMPLLLEASPRALPFYKHLGCTVPMNRQRANRVIITQEIAQQIFMQVTDRILT